MGPHTIGRYEIIRELGRGGMAVVYLARDPNMERQVAVKVLPRQFTHDPEFLKRFRREARVIASLEHSAIVPIYDFDEHDGQPYIVMRYMPGGSLAERLEKGSLTLTEAAAILHQLAPALDEAHERGIVHRDLKPGNILLDRRGDPYLADFGIVKLAEGAATALTASGGSMGTPAYVSPEQARGIAQLDGRSDIYTLGVILFEMLTGERPYQADTPIGLAVMHIMEPVPQICDRKRHLPPACQTVISKAMAKEREARYATTGELAAAAAALAGGKLAPPPETPETEFTPPDFVRQVARKARPRRRIRVWAWAAGGLLALVIVAVLLLSGLGLLGGEDEIAAVTETGVPPRPTGTELTAVPLSSATSTATETTPLTATATEAPSPPPTATETPNPTPTGTPTLMTPVPTRQPGEISAFPLPGGESVIMVWVPAGEFIMGSSDADIDAILASCSDCERDWFTDEQPQHSVYLDSFWIDQTEVTNVQYAACVAAGTCDRPGKSSSYGRDSYYGNSDYDDSPVIWVSWDDADTYCTWRDARLPTEAEWEKAARGGSDTRMYPWGDQAADCTLANFYNGSYCVGDTSQVGDYLAGASPYGAMDLSGNVWEWVNDWYDGSYYSVSPYSNPPGSAGESSKVLRGGSFTTRWLNVRAANRYPDTPVIRYNYIGFRCAAAPPGQ